MRKVFPLEMLDRLFAEADARRAPESRRVVRTAHNEAEGRAQQMFALLSKSLQPANDGIDSEWE